MSCKRIQRRISAFLDAELPADEARRIEEHLARCRACAREARVLAASYQLLELCPPDVRRQTPVAREDVRVLPASGVWRLGSSVWRLAIRRAGLPVMTGLLTGALLGLWLWPTLSPPAAPADARPIYQRDAEVFGALARDPLEEVYVRLTAAPRR
jgi:anti-sigma factor RsiW